MKKLVALTALILLVVAGSGCQLFNSTPTSPENSVVENTGGEINLDDELGGFTISDEAPAFGEVEAYEPLLVQEPTFDDPFQYTNEYQKCIRERRARHYRLRAIWGHLPRLNPDSITTDYCPLDWTGSLHAEGGVVLIEKVIAFEPNDYIKRVDRSTISWISHTGPHIDGVQVRIVFPPEPIDSIGKNYDRPFTVTIETPQFSRKFTIDELDSLNLLEPVDRCGDGISIVSYRIIPHIAHGHLMGEWHLLPVDSTTTSSDSTDTGRRLLGKFKGIWFSDAGVAAGYLRGVFGINSNGEKVFFGKYIDMDGRFKGILKGYYGICEDDTTDCEFPKGWFKGVWIDRNRLIHGDLKGHWIADNSGSGYFHGRWKSRFK